MTCKNCGSIVDEGVAQCPNCGATISADEAIPAPATEDAAPQENAEAIPAPPENEKTAKKKYWLIGAAAVVLIAALLIVFGTIRQKNYEAAAALYDAGQYTQAAEAFTKLGRYQDSADRAALSQNWADYTSACDLMEPFRHDDAVKAKQIFLALGQFKDAPQKAALCQNKLDYEAADALETAGDFAGAMAAFKALGSYENAVERARFCSDTLDYQAACALIEQGDYAAAAEKLAAPAESEFEDAADQLAYCNCKVDYAAAEQLLASGENYAAYKAFLALNSFEDAGDRAKGCVLENPKNGELYHNENYAYKQTELTVVNSYDKATFLKLYFANGDLVCSFYIASGKSATVRVPAGTYTLNRAFGKLWFGPDDMFGDEGTYYRQLIGDSYEFTMLNNYIYTLSAGTSGTPVEDSSTSRNNF